MHYRQKKDKALMKNFILDIKKKFKDYSIFELPVTERKLLFNLYLEYPQLKAEYLNEIEYPICFRDMLRKTYNEDEYYFISAFKKDLKALWKNCLKFNKGDIQMENVAKDLKKLVIKNIKTFDDKVLTASKMFDKKYGESTNNEQNNIQNFMGIPKDPDDEDEDEEDAEEEKKINAKSDLKFIGKKRNRDKESKSVESKESSKNAEKSNDKTDEGNAEKSGQNYSEKSVESSPEDDNENISKEDTPKGDTPQEDTPQEDTPQEDTPQEEVKVEEKLEEEKETIKKEEKEDIPTVENPKQTENLSIENQPNEPKKIKQTEGELLTKYVIVHNSGRDIVEYTVTINEEILKAQKNGAGYIININPEI